MEKFGRPVINEQIVGQELRDAMADTGAKTTALWSINFMLGKFARTGLAVLCITVLLVFTLTRDRLCPVSVKSGSTEI